VGIYVCKTIPKASKAFVSIRVYSWLKRLIKLNEPGSLLMDI